MNTLLKSALREIIKSKGRYLAIFIIVALGVGFFTGLRACRPSLTETAGVYYKTQNLFDFKMLSSVGFSKDAPQNLANQSNISFAQGAYSEDVIFSLDGNETNFRVHSITRDINKLAVISGRLPSCDNECVIDADYATADMIGKTLSFSKENNQDLLNTFHKTEHMIVGIVRTPLYISSECGATSLGNGNISAFLFVSETCFIKDYYQELYVSLKDRPEVYSNSYDDYISDLKPEITELSQEQADLRYESIVEATQSDIDDAKQILDQSNADLQAGKSTAIQKTAEQLLTMGQTATNDNPNYAQAVARISDSFAEAEAELSIRYGELTTAQNNLDELALPTVYGLTRSENTGYTAFTQDSTIIENISVVFPIFFFLVSVLVCATTMTRMIDEQRTQIGVLKAMGYSKSQIVGKYLLYAGSAGIFGSIIGFFAGTAIIPMIFWYAYSTSYNFADQRVYVFDPTLYALSLLIALLCTAGVTLFCCRKELRDVPATILRPKALKKGKRIFLERFNNLWQHISFLHKVSLRNVLRYKQRFILMILGISGCTALLCESRVEMLDNYCKYIRIKIFMQIEITAACVKDQDSRE
jgi:putative ABC transport system permease protein